MRAKGLRDMITYEEWLVGRPCLSREDEDFVFELEPGKKEGLRSR
jgi:hypothetical protein